MSFALVPKAWWKDTQHSSPHADGNRTTVMHALWWFSFHLHVLVGNSLFKAFNYNYTIICYIQKCSLKTSLGFPRVKTLKCWK